MFKLKLKHLKRWFDLQRAERWANHAHRISMSTDDCPEAEHGCWGQGDQPRCLECKKAARLSEMALAIRERYGIRYPSNWTTV